MPSFNIDFQSLERRPLLASNRSSLERFLRFLKRNIPNAFMSKRVKIIVIDQNNSRHSRISIRENEASLLPRIIGAKLVNELLLKIIERVSSIPSVHSIDKIFPK